MRQPIIGIAPDFYEPRPGSVRAMAALTYGRAIAAAGGMPVILVPEISLIEQHLELCDGFVMVGGDDPRTEAFGAATDPRVTPVHEARQGFDLAFLSALAEQPDTPVLGICLGMQWMGLQAGGTLNQYMPDNTPTHEAHWNDAVHAVEPEAGLRGQLAAVFSNVEREGAAVTSAHRQAIADPGSLCVAARAPDGIIEAVEEPDRRFYVGVQWHPERTKDDAVGVGVFRRLVEAARR